MFINTTTLEYPVSEAAIRNRHPNTSFPLLFTGTKDYAQVLPAIQPVVDRKTHYLNEGVPVNTAKGWQQTWEVIPLDSEQIVINTQASALSIQANIISSVQSRLDAFAQTKFYDGILSACTYATSSVPKFMVEGQYAVTARDATWSAANSILEAVLAGTRPVPSGYAEIEPELPMLTWPVVP